MVYLNTEKYKNCWSPTKGAEVHIKKKKQMILRFRYVTQDSLSAWGNLFGPMLHKVRHKQEQKREYWRPIKENNIYYKNNKISCNVKIQIVRNCEFKFKNFIRHFKLKTAKRPVIRPANYTVWWHKE